MQNEISHTSDPGITINKHDSLLLYKDTSCVFRGCFPEFFLKAQVFSKKNKDCSKSPQIIYMLPFQHRDLFSKSRNKEIMS